jgi:hypothetical protein
MPRIRAKERDRFIAEPARAAGQSRRGSAGVGGRWSDARLRDEQFDAAKDRAGELEEPRLDRRPHGRNRVSPGGRAARAVRRNRVAVIAARLPRR